MPDLRRRADACRKTRSASSTGLWRRSVSPSWRDQVMATTTICGVLVISFFMFAIEDGDEMPHLWLFAAGTVVMEGLFIYSLFKARRDVE